MIVTHRGVPRARLLGGPVRPQAALAALADRPRTAMVRHGAGWVIAADPVEAVVGADVWTALGEVPVGPPTAHAMAGGWIGLLGYELAGTLERLPAPHADPGGPPTAALARYETVALVGDDGRCTLAGVGPPAELDRLERALARAPWEPVGTGRGPVRTSLPAHAYRDAAEAIRRLIRAGDCYQVNLVQRLSAGWRGSPLALARALWEAAGAASHRAYLDLPGGTVVSASPERLVRAAGGVAASEPIKGTAPPGEAAALAASEKDRAEHVMIVDLVRNDLGRVARPGGVSVPRPFAPLSTPYAEHLVSEVRAELRPGTTAAALLGALFPGGSVTGAPKVRAMEVIRDLEPVARGPAFGSVVAVGTDGSVEASVAIRTAWLAGGEVRYWSGGAVTWGSDPEAERQEAWAKAAPFLRALGV